MQASQYWIALAFTAASLPAQTPRSFSPLDEVNNQLPAWLSFSGEERLRLEGFGGGGVQPNNNGAYLLQRLRLNMKQQHTNWLTFQCQTQDARVFFMNPKPYAPPLYDTWRLRLALVGTVQD